MALARALAPQPKVLLLDEPLSALDYKLRKEMQIELKRLQHETGITFIFVTHDQEEALTMSDRIAVMSSGKILQVGSPRDIYDRPAERFVADFIGETNFLKADGSTVARRPGAGDACTRARNLRRPPAEGFAPSGKVTLVVRPEHAQLARQRPARDLHGHDREHRLFRHRHALSMCGWTMAPASSCASRTARGAGCGFRSGEPGRHRRSATTPPRC